MTARVPPLLAIAMAFGALPTVAQDPRVDADINGSEVRLGLQFGSLQGSLSEASTISGANGSLSGAELYARTGGIGVVVRTQSNALMVEGAEHGRYTMRDARLMIGTRRLSLELGIGDRTIAPGASKERTSFGRAGIRTQWGIGGSGFEISLDAGIALESFSNDGRRTIRYRGHDGEALLLYKAPRRLPLFAAIGWRLQTFDDLVEVPSEVSSQSGPVFSVGLRVGP